MAAGDLAPRVTAVETAREIETVEQRRGRQGQPVVRIELDSAFQQTFRRRVVIRSGIKRVDEHTGFFGELARRRQRCGRGRRCRHRGGSRFRFLPVSRRPQRAQGVDQSNRQPADHRDRAQPVVGFWQNRSAPRPERRSSRGGSRRCLTAEQARDALRKRLGGVLDVEPRPLHFPESVGHARRSVGRVVDHDGKQKRLIVRHQMRTIDGEFPFEAEVALGPCVRVGRNHRHEQCAVLDLPPNLSVPGITTDQFILIEPHLHARRAQRLTDTARRLRVLGRVAQEDGAGSGRWDGSHERGRRRKSRSVFTGARSDKTGERVSRRSAGTCAHFFADHE